MILPVTRTLQPHHRNDVVLYTFPTLDAIGWLRHGISTRLGGVSAPPYDSMNLSFTRGDDRGCVDENWRRFAAAVHAVEMRPVMSAQIHHTSIRVVTAADADAGFTRRRNFNDADGLITDTPGLLLCTLYADCVPLILADPVRRAVGAIHAGWRGTANNIADAAVAAMTAAYGSNPADILAGIAPSIGPCCFAVDKPVVDAFAANPVFDADCYREAAHGKYYIDLWEVNRRNLCRAGVLDAHIAVGRVCTRCHPGIFWSHRAAGSTRGSLAVCVGIAEDVAR